MVVGEAGGWCSVVVAEGELVAGSNLFSMQRRLAGSNDRQCSGDCYEAVPNKHTGYQYIRSSLSDLSDSWQL